MNTGSKARKVRPSLALSTSATRAAKALLPALFRTAVREADRWVRSGEPEALHDLRVAARRYRAAVRFFRPLLDPRPVRALVCEMNRLADASGPVRDADVDTLLNRRTCAREDRDASSRTKLRTFLEGREFRRLEAKASALHDRIRSRSIGSNTPSLGRLAATRLEKRLRALADSDLEDCIHGPSRVHETRKKARCLRYWAEMLVPACGVRMRKLASILHTVTTSLGELHDVDVAIDRRGKASRRMKRLRRARASRALSAWSSLTDKNGRRVLASALRSTEDRKNR